MNRVLLIIWWCVVLSIITVGVVGCAKTKKSDDKTETKSEAKSEANLETKPELSFWIGDYVYLDDMRVAHSMTECPKLQNGKNLSGHTIYAMRPIDVESFVFGEYERVCSNCVSTLEFEKLKQISDRNKNIEDIYNTFVKNNYDMGTYDEFLSDISEAQYRNALYDEAIKIGLYKVGEYDLFVKKLGY